MTLSQPLGVYFNDLPGYVYLEVAGAGVTTYVIDSGVNQDIIVRSLIYAKSESYDIRSG